MITIPEPPALPEVGPAPPPPPPLFAVPDVLEGPPPPKPPDEV